MKTSKLRRFMIALWLDQRAEAGGVERLYERSDFEVTSDYKRRRPWFGRVVGYALHRIDCVFDCVAARPAAIMDAGYLDALGFASG